LVELHVGAVQNEQHDPKPYPVVHEIDYLRRYRVVRRTSRFSVVVTDGKSQHVTHLTNSGRLRDLIFPGSACLCIPKRPAKTTLRLVGVPVSERWAVLVDPGEQSKAFVSAARAGLIPWLAGWSITGSEVDCGESRIDLEIRSSKSTGYIEIKSAAMLIDGNTGSFPDCPTLRGRKHVGTLSRLAADHRCIILFLVQHPDAVRFSPSVQGDPVFAADISGAVRDGVEAKAVKMCLGTDGKVALVDPDLNCCI
jgi:sugar fermentation stimulation protein A